MSRMPITSAATSMSRTAIHARPMLLRTMFLAPSAITTTIVRTSRYFSTALSKVTPRIVICWAVMTPDELSFENHGNFTSAQTMKNCAASVATAR